MSGAVTKNIIEMVYMKKICRECENYREGKINAEWCIKKLKYSTPLIFRRVFAIYNEKEYKMSKLPNWLKSFIISINNELPQILKEREAVTPKG